MQNAMKTARSALFMLLICFIVTNTSTAKVQLFEYGKHFLGICVEELLVTIFAEYLWNCATEPELRHDFY